MQGDTAILEDIKEDCDEDLTESQFVNKEEEKKKDEEEEVFIDPSGGLDNMDMFLEDFMHDCYKEQINYELDKSPEQEYCEFFPDNSNCYGSVNNEKDITSREAFIVHVSKADDKNSKASDWALIDSIPKDMIEPMMNKA